MCGIAVAIDWPDSEAVVRRLIGGILHRGDITDPIFSPRPNTAMCTRRLRIVDAENAIQPQLSSNGRIAVSFNGEIYNYLDLKRELQALGIVFKTASDTEVLANALQAWGPAALGKLVGMFAFVAVDTAAGTFLAARDTFGVKPLYVIQSASGFLFCSEMRPLLDTVAVGDVMLLPPGYMLARNACVPFKTSIGIPDDCAFAGRCAIPRRSAQRRGAIAPAERSSGRDHVQRRHRQHFDRALRAPVSSGSPGLFRRRRRRAGLSIRRRICRSNRLRPSMRAVRCARATKSLRGSTMPSP